MAGKTQEVTLPLTTVVDGRTWHLFSVEFDTADGKFSTYIYALDSGHAGLIVEEMKQTLTLSGQLAGVY
jgi:hypothetical protein